MIQNFFKCCLLLLSASFLIIKAGYIDNRDLPLWSFPFHVNSEKASAFQSFSSPWFQEEYLKFQST